MTLGLHIGVHPEAATLHEARRLEKLAREYPEKWERKQKSIAIRNEFLRHQHVRNLISEKERLTGDLLDRRIPGVRAHALKNHLKDITEQLKEHHEKHKK